VIPGVGPTGITSLRRVKAPLFALLVALAVPATAGAQALNSKEKGSSSVA